MSSLRICAPPEAISDLIVVSSRSGHLCDYIDQHKNQVVLLKDAHSQMNKEASFCGQARRTGHLVGVIARKRPPITARIRITVNSQYYYTKAGYFRRNRIDIS